MLSISAAENFHEEVVGPLRSVPPPLLTGPYPLRGNSRSRIFDLLVRDDHLCRRPELDSNASYIRPSAGYRTQHYPSSLSFLNYFPSLLDSKSQYLRHFIPFPPKAPWSPHSTPSSPFSSLPFLPLPFPSLATLFSMKGSYAIPLRTTGTTV